MSQLEKYGIFIGRFQPLHNAHLKLIKIIMADKLKPFIVIGSTQEKRNLKRNPLTFEQRRQLIQGVLPIENIVALEDCYSNIEKWYSNLIKLLPAKEDCVIYYCVKQPDKSNFTFKGKTYTDETYHKIFKQENWTVKEINKLDEISSTQLRQNPDLCQEYTPKEVYHLLKKFKFIN